LGEKMPDRNPTKAKIFPTEQAKEKDHSDAEHVHENIPKIQFLF
jgi:hypothetical protein